jgi:hypothetical protein
MWYFPECLKVLTISLRLQRRTFGASRHDLKTLLTGDPLLH